MYRKLKIRYLELQAKYYKLQAKLLRQAWMNQPYRYRTAESYEQIKAKYLETLAKLRRCQAHVRKLIMERGERK